MAKVYRFASARQTHQPTFFDRNELNQLLSLYSRRVASGEWRDYAIDHRGGCAVFSVFRHTHAAPVYTIAKRTSRNGGGREITVASGRQTVRKSTTMHDALAVFSRPLKVVS